MEGRVLAIDPGAKRLGIAISDPYRILATPLTVIKHENMDADCDKIFQLCQQNYITLILVGQALSSEGEETSQSRHSRKLTEKIGSMMTIPVLLWDESESTMIAKRTALEMGKSRKKRTGHIDDRAAAVILQSFLDSQSDRSMVEQAT